MSCGGAKSGRRTALFVVRGRVGVRGLPDAHARLLSPASLRLSISPSPSPPRRPLLSPTPLLAALFPAPPLLPNSIGFPPLTHPSIPPSLHSPPTPSSSHAPTFPPFLPSLPLSFPSFTSLPSLFTFPLSLSRCGGPRGLLRRTLQRRPHERGERGERGESCYGGDA